MPPKVKFQKEEIVAAAFDIVRTRGCAALTSRELASALGVSTRPIFTYFDTMEQLRGEIYSLAKKSYDEYVRRGLDTPLPFLGVWRQYMRFAGEEPELYKLLFLTPPAGPYGGAAEAMRSSRDISRESIMRFYKMDAATADKFFRDLWLVAYSFATMTVTGNCPYTEEEIFDIGAGVSLSLYRSYKEIPGFAEGDYDRDAIFRELINK